MHWLYGVHYSMHVGSYLQSTWLQRGLELCAYRELGTIQVHLHRKSILPITY